MQAGHAVGAVAGTGAWRAAPGKGRPPRPPGSLPYPKLPAGTDTIPQVEYIVVLIAAARASNPAGATRATPQDRLAC